MKIIDKIIDNIPDWAYFTIAVIMTFIISMIGIWGFLWAVHFIRKILPTP